LRDGSFGVDNPNINEDITPRNIESPDVSTLIQTQGNLTLGVFLLQEQILSRDLKIHFENINLGVYLLFYPSKKILSAPVNNVDDETTVTVD
jgi:hypothetical protein